MIPRFFQLMSVADMGCFLMSRLSEFRLQMSILIPLAESLLQRHPSVPSGDCLKSRVSDKLVAVVRF